MIGPALKCDKPHHSHNTDQIFERQNRMKKRTKQNEMEKKNTNGMDFVYHIYVRCVECIDTFEFIRDILCAAAIFETH